MLLVNKEIVGSLNELGNSIQERFKTSNTELHALVKAAYQQNRWFTPANIEYALQSVVHSFLNEEKLERWLSLYQLKDATPPVKIGIVMAGNIPLVGFHDLLSVIVTGNDALIKLSSKDNILLPFLLRELFMFSPELKRKIEITERLNHADAIIATGSNNTSRYFEYYFNRFPKILRRNRGSVAILSGKEKKDDFLNLGTDIFRYFGLGCRNVSKIFVPEKYSFNDFFGGIIGFADIINHNKYKNNYDYNRTLLLMSGTPFLTNDFLILRENTSVSSPVATLHFERYSSGADLQKKIAAQQNDIQCIVGDGYIPFGKSQEPELWDYADNTDVIRFMQTLTVDSPC